MLEDAGFEVVRTKFDSFKPTGDCIIEERYYITAQRTSGAQSKWESEGPSIPTVTDSLFQP